MADVFISYARRDRGRIQRLLDALGEYGFSVWFDDGTLEGEALESHSMQELANATVVVVVWSTTAVRSRVVRSEAEIALQQGKLVSVRTDGAPISKNFVDQPISDLRAWAGDTDDADWLELLGRIEALTGPDRQPPPPPMPFEEDHYETAQAGPDDSPAFAEDRGVPGGETFADQDDVFERPHRGWDRDPEPEPDLDADPDPDPEPVRPRRRLFGSRSAAEGDRRYEELPEDEPEDGLADVIEPGETRQDLWDTLDEIDKRQREALKQSQGGEKRPVADDTDRRARGEVGDDSSLSAIAAKMAPRRRGRAALADEDEDDRKVERNRDDDGPAAKGNPYLRPPDGVKSDRGDGNHDADEADDEEAYEDWDDGGSAWDEVRRRLASIGMVRIVLAFLVVIGLTGGIVSFLVFDPMGLLPGSVKSDGPTLAPEPAERLATLQGPEITGEPSGSGGETETLDTGGPESVPETSPLVLSQQTDEEAGQEEMVDNELQTGVGDSYSAGSVFKDCENCPSMVIIPPGTFIMGSSDNEEGREDFESPRHIVNINYSFAVSQHEITYDDWDACVAGGGCGGYQAQANGGGRGQMPVVFVKWQHAKSYVDWLSRKTGKPYRLLSEAEWEYAARAGTDTPFFFGSTVSTDQANYHGDYVYGTGQKGRVRGQATKVGTFKPNAFGLYDMHGNVWEWVEDCWNPNYKESLRDGSPRRFGQCDRHVVRGGAWAYPPALSRSASRSWTTTQGLGYVGFRVARDIPARKAQLRENMQP